MTGRKTEGRRGFTLMELLVVIALMVILSAILFPVFAQAREKGRQGVCIGNLKQIATAMSLYCDDNDDTFPLVLGREDRDEPLFPTSWMAYLQPYLKSTAVLTDAAAGQDWQTASDLQASYGFAPSYRTMGCAGITVTAPPFGTAMWDGIGGFAGPPVGSYRQAVPSLARAQVARPTEMILVSDHRVFDWGLSRDKLFYPAPRHLREADMQLPDGRTFPQGILNATFVDGHVKALRHERFWTILRNYSCLGRPTRDVYKHFWPYE